MAKAVNNQLEGGWKNRSSNFKVVTEGCMPLLYLKLAMEKIISLVHPTKKQPAFLDLTPQAPFMLTLSAGHIGGPARGCPCLRLEDERGVTPRRNQRGRTP